jgi:hypothetical protein
MASNSSVRLIVLNTIGLNSAQHCFEERAIKLCSIDKKPFPYPEFIDLVGNVLNIYSDAHVFITKEN